MTACYLALAESGQLQERIDAAIELLSPCEACPRACRVDRLADEHGFCRAGRRATVASFSAHFGEERPLVGTHGSGTIFFSGCNLGCIFCQNYDISHFARGRQLDASQLAAIMLQLQDAGCHNINFVTPTHVVPQVLEALSPAIEAGLAVPLVYNCGGYENLEMLRLLDGVIDIYMPDAKYADASVAAEFSDAPDYPDRMYEALAEMHRQVGDLSINADGTAERGLLVRHLVLPDDMAGTARIMEFLASLSPDTYVNVMDQYHPCHQAVGHNTLGRRITSSEYHAAGSAALDAGLTRLDDRVRI